MYISKIAFNKSSAFEAVIDSEYKLHQAVWDLFADSPDRKRDFLYRLDCIGRSPLVHAISCRKPIDGKGLWCVESKEYAPKVDVGIKLGFDVRVSPTIKRDGKRHDVVMDAKYKGRMSKEKKNRSTQELIYDASKTWLDKRARENGFKTLQCRADGYQQIKFYKAKSGALVRFSTIDITGIVEVVEPKLFVEILFNGLGPEKGFGCGLMLVRKI